MAWSYIITAVCLLFESLLLQGVIHSQLLQMSTENSHIWQGKVWITAMLRDSTELGRAITAIVDLEIYVFVRLYS